MKEEYGAAHRWGKCSGLPVGNRPVGTPGARIGRVPDPSPSQGQVVLTRAEAGVP